MNPLEQLRDIHTPELIHQWPLAYGWWILALLVCATVIATIVGYVRWRKRSAAKRHALKLISELSPQDKHWPQLLNQVMKRASLSYFPQQQVAGLHMGAWTRFQSNLLPAGKRQQFSTTMDGLQAALYRENSPSPDFDAACKQASIWLTHALPPKRRRGGEDV